MLHSHCQLLFFFSNLVILQGSFVFECFIRGVEQCSRLFWKSLKDANIRGRNLSQNFVFLPANNPCPINFLLQITPFILLSSISLDSNKISEQRIHVQIFIHELNNDSFVPAPFYRSGGKFSFIDMDPHFNIFCFKGGEILCSYWIRCERWGEDETKYITCNFTLHRNFVLSFRLFHILSHLFNRIFFVDGISWEVSHKLFVWGKFWDISNSGKVGKFTFNNMVIFTSIIENSFWLIFDDLNDSSSRMT